MGNVLHIKAWTKPTPATKTSNKSPAVDSSEHMGMDVAICMKSSKGREV